jgi:hypothetical protein
VPGIRFKRSAFTQLNNSIYVANTPNHLGVFANLYKCSYHKKMRRICDIYFLVESPRLLYICALYTGKPSHAKAMAIFPLIILKSKKDIPSWLITHERIHFQQQLELLIIGSYILTIIEYIYARMILKLSGEQAYLWGSSEQEAYQNHGDVNYLYKRKMFQRFKYFKNKKQIFFDEIGTIKIT